MRVATWNLDHGRGTRSSEQNDLLSSLACDVVVLTEPGRGWLGRENVVTSPAERVGPTGAEAWVVISASSTIDAAAVLPFERLAAAALTRLGSHLVLIYASVLPWRGIARHAPELLLPGEAYSQAFRRVLEEQVADIGRLRSLHPEAIPIWAGDFNQSLVGVNDTGTTAGRALVLEALDGLGLVPWNASEPHARPERCAIDLICGPRNFRGETVARIDPVANGRRLSDHAGYVVEIALR